MSSKLTNQKGENADDKTVSESGNAAAAAGNKVRCTKMVEALAEKTPEKVGPLGPFFAEMEPLVAKSTIPFNCVLPYIVAAITRAHALLKKLPENELYATLGFFVCFFGGVFPGTIAAVEAWRLCSGLIAPEASQHCSDVWNELSKVKEVSDEDNKKDDDNNGVADVDEITAKELLQRKTLLALKAVEPKRLSGALEGFVTSCFGVVAVFEMEGSRTLMLAKCINETLHELASGFEPCAKAEVDEDYHKWIPVAMEWACRAVALLLASWVTRSSAAFHSAIRGGEMVGKYFGNKYYGLALAAYGLAFQIKSDFRVPWQLNFVLSPFIIVERFALSLIGATSNELTLTNWL